MKLPANAHVAVVDGEHFLLMRNCGTTAMPLLESEGHPAVDEIDCNRETFPQDNARRVFVRPLDKSVHAAGAAEWLNRAVLSHRIDQLLVVADPDTLGEMRHHYLSQTRNALLGELGRQLTDMPDRDILKVILAA